MTYDAIVIGGGLAGCSAAHQLARRGWEVVLLEKDTYPRHKLCGEFLSPEAQSSLSGLNLLEEVRSAGARRLRRARLTGPNGTTAEHGLPGTALGLSRYRLDTLLFRAARRVGVDGRPGTKATAVTGSLGDGFVVEAGGDALSGRLVLGAYGRRSPLDRRLDRPFLGEQSPYVAFKAHYAGTSPELPGTVEVHTAPGGYCGIGPVEEDRFNVCWIGRTDALKRAGGTAPAMLDEMRRHNPVLDDRMRDLVRVSDRFEAVSQVPLMSKSQFVDGVCMIGDSAGMIAPLCGDGMAMALDTADLVAPMAEQFLSGRRSPAAFRADYRDRWRSRYQRRLRLGRWAHAAAFRPLASTALLTACRVLPPLARWLIRSTRG
ncbi:MAG: NAD(P)/FAD-dependent oxidoreductase [Salinibacter sp.]